MWDRTDRSARPAREFAQAHGLVYAASANPAATDLCDGVPFAGLPMRHHVSGQWRGRPAERWEAARYTIEKMQLPRPLPSIRIVPQSSGVDTPATGSTTFATGDADFDRRWSVTTESAHYAAALLDETMREALMHPAAEGRALAIRGETVTSWAHNDATWADARVRLDFLAVVLGRITPNVWERFSPVAPVPVAPEAVWTPAPQQEQDEFAQWAIAPVPEAPHNDRDDAGPDSLTDTGEFEVALFNAQLNGTTFLPHPAGSEDEEYSSWRVAPLTR
ncbi:hypothetical protein LGT39_09140 [Demequina sp. TTPB684]|uniref:hypothetical protein n=1 Tax=unclassified Demequina TaxID=2620311 RepID=UPI001CF11FEE|nr:MULTISPECIES: hypothetical protein [unclassified Demequina]MCB2413008.1 hypothetical protein [Demequina sp. TTPB684]UPU87077.1 hypothetical protein LGT36_007220 [Demequina sp. TMPB413]